MKALIEETFERNNETSVVLVCHRYIMIRVVSKTEIFLQSLLHPELVMNTQYFSMGSIMMHYFLQQQTQAWKDKHIRYATKRNHPGVEIGVLTNRYHGHQQILRALITLAGVWGGTARALKVFALGDNLDSW